LKVFIIYLVLSLEWQGIWMGMAQHSWPSE
jgi:hypothetical protein